MEQTYLGFDYGAGGIKLYGSRGGIQLPAQAAAAVGERLGKVAGLRSRRPPMLVTTERNAFYVGAGAHDWGRPVENLADERFTGSPEVRHLTYGVFSHYFRQYGPVKGSVELMVGLPQSALSDENANATIKGIQSWLTGDQVWQANEQRQGIAIRGVTCTLQAAGALFDYLLDGEGQFIPQRKAFFKKEIGIISIGMSTLEMLVVQNGKPVQRFTHGQTAGVRRLLEIVDPSGLYSRGELDTRLRAGRLDYREALPTWASEINGHLERYWGKAYQRFAHTIVVGGGAILLRDQLLVGLNGKAFVPDDPVLSIARGLFKMSLMRTRRRRQR